MRSRVFDKNKIETPAVHYFHQVDDPYSFLSVQKFKVLQASYDINFTPHLVGAPETTRREMLLDTSNVRLQTLVNC